MLSTCCVQHVAAGGLNRVTAEARFLSLFWFYLWGKHRYTVEAQMSQFYSGTGKQLTFVDLCEFVPKPHVGARRDLCVSGDSSMRVYGECSCGFRRLCAQKAPYDS